MDGGGRLLRSLGEAGSGFFPDARPRFAGPFAAFLPGPAIAPPPPRARGPVRTKERSHRAPPRGLGVVLAAALLGAAGLYGAVRGGQYQTFVAANGQPADILARAVGFPITAVTISGIKELTPLEILEGGGVSARNSLALLDAAALRDKLKTLPLVREATIRKLFPQDLAIAITEREPVALWQHDGQISLIAADGVPIDAVRDDRFNALPFVVGDGANRRLDEFLSLLAAAGELRDQIRAAVRVGDRRWTLKMRSGVEVALPEQDPSSALRRLADVERQSRVLEKDVLSLDLRIAGRITVRLSEDAAAVRFEALAKKPKGKAGTT